MPINGYTGNLPSDVLLLPGVLYIGSTPIGVFRKGGQFEPGHEFVNLEFPGKQSPIKLLDRKFFGTAKFSGTLIEIGEAATGNQAAKLEPGVASATAGSPSVTTLTPEAGGTFLASGRYQSNVRLIYDRGVGTGTKRYFAILFACGLFTKYGPISGEGTREEAEIPFEVEARKDMSSGVVGDAPYVLEYREALP